MAVLPLPIANGAYTSDSLPISAQECVNWYVNIVQAPALNQETLFGTPGLELLDTSGPSSTDINRGSHALEGTPYFVNDNELLRMESNLTLTVVGTIAGTGRLWMAGNGTQLIILVPGGAGYIFTEDPDTLTTITDADFTTTNGAPQAVVFIDGFFCATTDAEKFIISALNNGLAWSALDFGTAESNPDNIVAPFVIRNQLYIAGDTTIEAFSNIGGADFPFRRTGLFFAKGIFAPFSVVNANDTVMFIGGGEDESPAIWQLAGNGLQKVSTTAIDSILQRLTQSELQNVFAWSYAQKGAYFVGFSLPMTTVVYDTITARWHERKSQVTGPTGVVATLRFRVNSIVSAYGRLLVGDSQDGRVGSMDIDIFSEYGANIIRRVATQPFQNNMKPLFVPMIELTIESGVGDLDTPDPQIRMERSLNGGQTFKDERSRPMGKIGEYNRRAIWWKNGHAQRFEVFRFTMSDMVKPVIIQLTADVR